MKKWVLALCAALMVFASCSLFEKEEDDNTLQLLTLAALLQPRTNCTNNSGMVLCIPPGFVTQ
ncbi:MAG: hypothetical protein KDK33_13295 [Leptospiraceae bacterium]|nr:hypothetical protein [Leptospiraceae bacterium]